MLTAIAWTLGVIAAISVVTGFVRFAFVMNGENLGTNLPIGIFDFLYAIWLIYLVQSIT